MPVLGGRRLPLIPVVLGLTLAATVAADGPSTGPRALLRWPILQGSFVDAFEETLLFREPLQVDDIRQTLNTAAVAARRGDWLMATRLVRDGRSQWDAFQLKMPDIYRHGVWSQADIARLSALWETAVQKASYRDLSGTLRALRRMHGAMNRYAASSASS